MSAPMVICPCTMRLAPNQTTAALAQLTTSMTTGNINAIRRPVATAVPVSW